MPAPAVLYLLYLPISRDTYTVCSYISCLRQGATMHGNGICNSACNKTKARLDRNQVYSTYTRQGYMHRVTANTCGLIRTQCKHLVTYIT